MKETAPLSIRVLLAIDQAFAAMGRTWVMLRNETLCAWTRKDAREGANRAIYSRMSTFLPGGATFAEGLFDWELDAIAASFPPSGRILLGAAGGGRELAGLGKMGYEVVAFEPSLVLADAAGAVAAHFPECKVIGAGYSDLVQAVEKGDGPLAPHVCGIDFHGVILGWTSFSYVWREERDALLKALFAVAPRAPVLLSYQLA